GFDTQRVAVATLDPGSLGYSEAQVRSFYEQLSRHIGALPGVSSTSFVNHLPLGSAREQSSAIEGNRSAAGQKGVSVDVLRVAPGYFETMGIPLLRGRDFIPKESESSNQASAGAAIINDAMARKLWPSQDPVGRRIRLGEDTGLEIIGVVKTGKYRTLGEEPIPLVYLPRLPSQRTLVVRTSGDPTALLDAIRREIQTVDPNIAATEHEIGVRMALGARRGDVLKLVFGHGLAVTSIGLAVGLAAAFGVTRFLSALLYGISPNDPVTLLSVSLGLALVALLACYLPARRAMRVDPMVALRYE
ncbi:MAG: hypothetical protein DMG53_10900, partial [Acidobacteria bacterium]